MRRISCALTLGLVLTLAACSPRPPAPTPSPTAGPTPAPVESPAPTGLVWRDQVFEQSFTAKDGAALMTARYLVPGVADAADNPAWAAIDAYYLSEGESYLETAQETAALAEGDYEATQAMGYDFAPYAEESYYAVTLQTGTVVSFRRTYYSAVGGPYPATFQFSEQFSLKDGSRLNFASCFSDPAAAKAAVLVEIGAQIAKREDAASFDLTRLERAFREDFFYLTADSMVFYFQEDELTPHAAGIPEFPIPYDSLEGVLLPW